MHFKSLILVSFAPLALISCDEQNSRLEATDADGPKTAKESEAEIRSGSALKFLSSLELSSGQFGEAAARGMRVRLEVEIEIERTVPLALLRVPDGSKTGWNHHVHLISATTIASDLKKGQRYFIEGTVVDGPCYGAYTVYVNGFYDPQNSPVAPK